MNVIYLFLNLFVCFLVIIISCASLSMSASSQCNDICMSA